jgi:hypothetical protein
MNRFYKKASWLLKNGKLSNILKKRRSRTLEQEEVIERSSRPIPISILYIWK